MKSRERQRANRRKYKGLASAAPQASKATVTSRTGQSRPKVVEKPWLNPEGYYDPTAYRAIRNVERGRRTTGRDRAATYN